MTTHLELLVEEPSMEALLRALLPRLISSDRTFEVHAFQGKSDLLGNLAGRLRGYARWLPDDWRIIVLVDRDDDDCLQLKQKLEGVAEKAKLRTRARAICGQWQLVNRIAIEELEAWYFGDWESVCTAYPRLPPSIPSNQRYRDPDGISGGTWEAFERVMQRSGYFKQGLRKIEVARELGGLLDARRSRSLSFGHFHKAVMEALS